MKQTVEMVVDGRNERVEVEGDPPLLTVLRNDVGRKAPKFGCGLAQCGACTVHMNGHAIRSCATPVSSANAARITTLEGLAAGGTLHAV